MASNQYEFTAIEQKWQAYWLKNKTFKVEIDRSRPKFYLLDMFPYPSGDGLHVGHVVQQAANDVLGRYKAMRGFNVLRPMGWDAFGLPAERHAVRTGEHPAKITQRNCDTFRRQIQGLGMSYDWDREINTTDPKYYKWTQWIFEVLFERGLAYQAEQPVNWCPALSTVLANEEVKDGKYVETGDPVEKRLLKQWVLKITEYAERLLTDLDGLDWPDSIKAMQREWIGRSEGADAIFKVAGGGAEFTVFTTRPDTLYGATYCVLAPEHPLTRQIAADEQKDAVEQYIAQAGKKSAQDRMREEREKTGVFTGAYAINPVNNKEVPIWTADYVLADYGYGAIMAVPAHDTRDYEFARKFDLPIIEVVSGGNIAEEAYTGDGVLVNSPLIDGLNVPDAKKRIVAHLEAQGLATATVNYKLRDWLFSRQRYWGEPFPLITLEDGTVRAVPVKDLPVVLPELDEYKPTADGRPPLARATDWVDAVDADTGQPARRETNTMPQWAGSCWYYLRFCDPRNDDEAWSKEADNYWMPVDLYVGGAEHAVLHLLYARFWHKVLFDAGYVHTKEPFQRLFNQGMILAQSYRDAKGKYHYPHQVEKRDDGCWVVKETGAPVETQNEKMSKSRYNVVNPDEVAQQYGADTLRMYMMFMGPLDREKPWSDEGVQGVHRFLRRVWTLLIGEDGGIHARIVDQDGDPSMEKALHTMIKAVTHDIEGFSYNTAISRMMEFVNAAMRVDKIDRAVIERFTLVLSPFAPHLAEEVWERLGHSDTLAFESWPEFDARLLVEDTVEIPVQVNGKVRGIIEVAPNADKTAVLAAAKENDKVRNYLDGKEMVKEIFVPGKMINFVIKQ
ncbi:MAG: leucine--tRNA ligase [Candidatus Hydrogenedentes bacterium]|nr:leucine--tRNA ligase [Candidatus Hydrogenedentota bacterium]